MQIRANAITIMIVINQLINHNGRNGFERKGKTQEINKKSPVVSYPN